MMDPSEAVILRTQAVERLERFIQTDHRWPHVDWLVRTITLLQQDTMRCAPLYTWRRDLLGAAMHASKTLPSPCTIQPSLAPSLSGMYVFDQPLRIDGCSLELDGAMWAPLDEAATVFWLLKKEQGFVLRSEANFILMNGTSPLDGGPGGDMRQYTDDSQFDMKNGADATVRFLLASWLWLKQSVMVPTKEATARHARKMAERVGVVSDVRVVLLRRAEAATAREPKSDWEYACQWMVRGHWRQQFYPSTSEHRPRWIDPYVKGPEGMPLKPPTETIFSVTR